MKADADHYKTVRNSLITMKALNVNWALRALYLMVFKIFRVPKIEFTSISLKIFRILLEI